MATAAGGRREGFCKSLQIINSSGPQAQQDVFHLHFHIVPRHTGDGQDVKWSPHPEMRERFDTMLERLRNETGEEASSTATEARADASSGSTEV